MADGPEKPGNASVRFTTATNLLVILIAIVVVSDPGGPIRTQIQHWVDQRQDRRIAEQTWTSITASSSPEPDNVGRPIVAVEFIDYQCRFCRRMETVKEQVGMPAGRVVTRHLPLEHIHPNASLAASISICAEARIPEDWQKVHRVLYEISDSLHAIDWPEKLEAAGVGQAGAVTECLDTEIPQLRLKEDQRYATLYRITGTPSYVFPHSVHRGAVGAETWAAWLDAATSGRYGAGQRE